VSGKISEPFNKIRHALKAEAGVGHIRIANDEMDKLPIE
jgi:hypothetical protein